MYTSRAHARVVGSRHAGSERLGRGKQIIRRGTACGDQTRPDQTSARLSDVNHSPLGFPVRVRPFPSLSPSVGSVYELSTHSLGWVGYVHKH